MKTFVAEINGDAVIAFRAEDSEQAFAIVNEEDGGLQLGLNGYSGLLRADGAPLWDGESEITARPATEDEHRRWLKGRDAAIRDADYQLDLKKGDDLDDFNVYLISVISVDAFDRNNERRAYAAAIRVGYAVHRDDGDNFMIYDPKTGGAVAGQPIAGSSFTFNADDVVAWCFDLPAVMSEEEADFFADAEIERLAEEEDESEDTAE